LRTKGVKTPRRRGTSMKESNGSNRGCEPGFGKSKRKKSVSDLHRKKVRLGGKMLFST